MQQLLDVFGLPFFAVTDFVLDRPRIALAIGSAAAMTAMALGVLA
jgi:hypothetical protein